MKQAKQVFQYGREKPSQKEEGEQRAAKRVYGGETMRRQRSVCVCVYECVAGGGGGRFFFSCKSQGCSGLTLPLIP